MSRTALFCSPLLAAVLLFAAACSQSTAHPEPLGDCRSATGCNPPLGFPTGELAPADSGTRDGSVAGDAGVVSDGAADAARD